MLHFIMLVIYMDQAHNICTFFYCASAKSHCCTWKIVNSKPSKVWLRFVEPHLFFFVRQLHVTQITTVLQKTLQVLFLDCVMYEVTKYFYCCFFLCLFTRIGWNFSLLGSTSCSWVHPKPHLAWTNSNVTTY